MDKSKSLRRVQKMVEYFKDLGKKYVHDHQKKPFYDPVLFNQIFRVLLTHKYGNTCNTFEIITFNDLFGKKNRTKEEYARLLLECIKESKDVFVVPITLGESNDPIKHANLLIYKKENNVFQLFEPHGISNIYIDEKGPFIDSFIASIVDIMNTMKDESMPEIKFEPTEITCPVIAGEKLGFQAFSDVFSVSEHNINIKGTCLSWSTLIGFLALENPALSTKEIVDLITKMVTEHDKYYNFTNIILGFIVYTTEYIKTYLNNLTDSELGDKIVEVTIDIMFNETFQNTFETIHPLINKRPGFASIYNEKNAHLLENLQNTIEQLQSSIEKVNTDIRELDRRLREKYDGYKSYIMAKKNIELYVMEVELFEYIKQFPEKIHSKLIKMIERSSKYSLNKNRLDDSLAEDTMMMQENLIDYMKSMLSHIANSDEEFDDEEFDDEELDDEEFGDEDSDEEFGDKKFGDEEFEFKDDNVDVVIQKFNDKISQLEAEKQRFVTEHDEYIVLTNEKREKLLDKTTFIILLDDLKIEQNHLRLTTSPTTSAAPIPTPAPTPAPVPAPTKRGRKAAAKPATTMDVDGEPLPTPAPTKRGRKTAAKPATTMDVDGVTPAPEPVFTTTEGDTRKRSRKTADVSGEEPKTRKRVARSGPTQAELKKLLNKIDGFVNFRNYKISIPTVAKHYVDTKTPFELSTQDYNSIHSKIRVILNLLSEEEANLLMQLFTKRGSTGGRPRRTNRRKVGRTKTYKKK